MKIRQIKKIAPALLRAGVQHGLSVHFKGKPGCGKSEFVENEIPQIAMDTFGCKEFPVNVQTLADIEAPDVRGFAIPAKEEDGNWVTRFTRSPLMPRAGSPEYGMVFLDEKNQAKQDVAKATSQFTLNKRAGEFQMPDTYVVWSASNRQSDRSGTTRELMHNVNREIQIDVESDVDSWCDWAFANNIHPLFVAFAKFKPGLIFDAEIPREPAPWCTPRSYVKFFELMDLYTGGNIDGMLSEDALAVEMGAGMIGMSTATEALAFMKVANHLPSIDKIVREPDVAAKQLPDGRPDVMFAACTMVIHHAKEENAEPIFNFITKLPKEFQVSTLANAATHTQGALTSVPGWAEWIDQNAELVEASF